MDSKIKLTVESRGGKSYMKNLYVSPPFRVVSVGQLRRDGGAYLCQMSTSPGMLSGDNYEIEIDIKPSARLQFSSQSYTRIFDMAGRATQRVNINIGQGGYFSQVSHPIVPHRNSSYLSTTHVDMGEGSTFLQSEIITCGRKHHGEEFEFRDFLSSVELYADGVLRLKDRVWLSPERMPLLGCGLLEGHTHQGTLLFHTTRTDIDISGYIETINEKYASRDDIEFGISKSHYSGFVVRVLGGSGEALHTLFLQIQELMWGV